MGCGQQLSFTSLINMNVTVQTSQMNKINSLKCGMNSYNISTYVPIARLINRVVFRFIHSLSKNQTINKLKNVIIAT